MWELNEVQILVPKKFYWNPATYINLCKVYKDKAE